MGGLPKELPVVDPTTDVPPGGTIVYSPPNTIEGVGDFGPLLCFLYGQNFETHPVPWPCPILGKFEGWEKLRDGQAAGTAWTTIEIKVE